MYQRKFLQLCKSFVGQICLLLSTGLILIILTGCEKDIVVVEDSANDNGYLTGKANGNPNAIRATSKQDMVDKVLNKLGKGDCIKTLTLLGDGSPVNISVGDGQGWENCKHINNNRDEWEDILSKLKERFCKGGRLVLFGCHVGACEKGRDKLQELADFLGVTTEAPTGEVYGDCTEEAGSEYQIAAPGGPKPPHEPSPSDVKKLELGKRIRELRHANKEKEKPGDKQVIPFDIDSLTGIAIYPVQLRVPTETDRIEYDYTSKEDIRRFISGIDFSHTINGTGLGADYDAYVFLKFDKEIKEYRICSDFDYFLAKGDWKNMYEISWDLEQELKTLVEQKLKRQKD